MYETVKEQRGSPGRRPLSNLNITNTDGSNPLSPTANLKLLTKVASNFEKQNIIQDSVIKNISGIKEVKKGFSLHCVPNRAEVTKSRKDRSLSLLCDKFLKLYPLGISRGDHMVVCIDQVAKKLGTERRRIYDIVNVLESLQMASKVGKNRYMWYGCQQLSFTLAKLKGLAIRLGLHDQVKSLQRSNLTRVHVVADCVGSVVKQCTDELYGTEDIYCQSYPSPSPSSTTSEMDSQLIHLSIVTKSCTEENSTSLDNEIQRSSSVSMIKGIDTASRLDHRKCLNPIDNICKEEKSLGVMCQKFIMLFLISDKADLLNLDLAAKILMSDASSEKSSCGRSNAMFQGSVKSEDKNLLQNTFTSRRFKTKVRRLYDIANVLTSLQLICKVQNLENNMRKPAFRYIGPQVEPVSSFGDEIHYSQVSRHSLLRNTVPFVNVKDKRDLTEDIYQEDSCEDDLQPSNPERKRKSQLIKESIEHSGKRNRTQSEHGFNLKKIVGHHQTASNDSLTEILQVAEIELKRLQSLETSNSSSTEKKGKVPTARKKLFSRHHSDSCVELNCQTHYMSNLAKFNALNNAAANVIPNQTCNPIQNVKKDIIVNRKLVKVIPIVTHQLQQPSMKVSPYLNRGGVDTTKSLPNQQALEVAETKASVNSELDVPVITQYVISNSSSNIIERPVPLSNTRLLFSSSNRDSTFYSHKTVLKTNPVQICMVPTNAPSTTTVIVSKNSNDSNSVITQLPPTVLSSGEMYKAVRVGGSIKLVPVCNNSYTTLTSYL